MIPQALLKLTECRALGICPYGGPGMKKSNGIHQCPPPILEIDFEGGAVSALPWVRRRRNWDSQEWTDYTQEERELVYNQATKGLDASQLTSEYGVVVKPAPYIDLVWFDPLEWGAYEKVVELIGNFDSSYYNTLAIDGLKDFSQETQTFSKGQGNWKETMSGMMWGGAQERLAILLRKARDYRNKGVFIYLTAGELIDKDYVKDPREMKKGDQPQEPYSVKGTVNLPGKMAGELQHLVDCMAHARPVNGKATWVFTPEPLPGGVAHWEAKDRTGRIKELWSPPSVRRILDQIYGEEIRRQIYAVGREKALTV